MIAFCKSGTSSHALTVIAAVGAIMPDSAEAGTMQRPYQSGFQRPAVVVTDGSPRAERWTLQSDAQLAAVAAGNGDEEVFLGVQCDPFNPAARRLVLGVQKGAYAP
jgi:hypothetical protein